MSVFLSTNWEQIFALFANVLYALSLELAVYILHMLIKVELLRECLIALWTFETQNIRDIMRFLSVLEQHFILNDNAHWQFFFFLVIFR